MLQVYVHNLSHLMRLWYFSSSINNLQMHMRSHPVVLNVWFLVGLFVYFHTLCVWIAKALARLAHLVLFVKIYFVGKDLKQRILNKTIIVFSVYFMPDVNDFLTNVYLYYLCKTQHWDVEGASLGKNHTCGDQIFLVTNSVVTWRWVDC